MRFVGETEDHAIESERAFNLLMKLADDGIGTLVKEEKLNEDLKAWAPKILEQVVWDRNMPVGNESGMTEEERALLARWIETLK